jgi:hypothetical protein
MGVGPKVLLLSRACISDIVGRYERTTCVVYRFEVIFGLQCWFFYIVSIVAEITKWTKITVEDFSKNAGGNLLLNVVVH